MAGRSVWLRRELGVPCIHSTPSRPVYGAREFLSCALGALEGITVSR